MIKSSKNNSLTKKQIIKLIKDEITKNLTASININPEYDRGDKLLEFSIILNYQGINIELDPEQTTICT